MYSGPFEEIDWDAIWDQKMAKTSFKGEGVEFWDNKAHCYTAMHSDSTYNQELLSRMDVRPGDEILDVGCGTGVLAIPLSHMVKHVTALDLSPVMLEELDTRIADQHISNIKVINANWTEIDIGSINTHDVVLASRSLPMGNLREALERMNRKAKRTCYLTWIADEIAIDRKISEALGKEYNPFPDHIIILNLLHEIGIKANVELFSVSSRRPFKSLDEALAGISKEISAESFATREAIRALLKQELIYDSGIYYDQRDTRWALIWWHKINHAV